MFEDTTNILIETESGEVIYNGLLTGYGKHFDLDLFEDEYIQGGDELYKPFMESESGVFLFWEDFQRGVLIDTEIETEKFEPAKLVFFECDLNGDNQLVTSIQYDGIELEFDFSGMNSKSMEFTLHDNR